MATTEEWIDELKSISVLELAERLLDRLDALGELEHGNALELLDPLLGRRHLSPLVS